MSLDGIGISQAWLRRFALEEETTRTAHPSYLSRIELGAFLFFLQDPAVIQSILRDYYATQWTDSIQLLYGTLIPFDGTIIKFGSSAQQAMMQPWGVEVRGHAYRTYNVDINLALLALLPPRFLGRGWLSPDNLKSVLDLGVWKRSDHECHPAMAHS
jgi:hypothetical protein